MAFALGICRKSFGGKDLGRPAAGRLPKCQAASCIGRTRTCDQWINSPRLYQLSYDTIKAHCEGIEPSPFLANQAMHNDQCFRLSAKQSTVYPPRDSTRVSRKKNKEAGLVRHTIYMGLDSQNACVSRPATSLTTRKVSLD